ncbi:MAG: YeeE/YedE family protein [Methylococcaceae bacterium]|nr:MAG: YeeE/YedE family protein [Methylococcaceae bacterium]
MPESWLHALLGGALIGCAACAFLYCNGRIAGISGIAAGLAPPAPGEWAWRAAFIAGLLLGGFTLLSLYPAAFPTAAFRSPPVMALAGLLVGLGAGLANGCTSGHGICGLALRSPRSLVAVLAFMSSGALTVYLLKGVWP